MMNTFVQLKKLNTPTFTEFLLSICNYKRLSTKRLAVPQLLLEPGDIDSDSDNLASPKVKNNNDNVITVPVHLKQRLQKKLIKENTAYFERQKIINASRLGNKARVVVQCKRPHLNYYYGQSYARNSEIPLASKGWLHRKSVGDSFTIKQQSQVSQELSAFGLNDEDSSFERLGLSSEICEHIQNNSIRQPTHIQGFAIPEILKGNNCLVAAETGCGKTLAYLLPIFQQILDSKNSNVQRSQNQPHSIVLVPSRELADQVFDVASFYAKALGIRVRLLQGGGIGAKIKDPSTSVVDLLIATVSVVSKLSSVGVFDMKGVEHVVLDEADSLLDDSFSDLVTDFLRKFYFHQYEDNKPVQLTLVSATLPRSVESILEEVVPVESLVRVSTPDLHKVLANVPQTFMRIKKLQKPEKVLELMQSDIKKNIPAMIFCNKNTTCEWLHHFLLNNGVDCVSLHGKKDIKYRRGLIDYYQLGKVNVVTCTDLGSRGLDTLRTGHVLNYDFPNFLADYIHRCGRTGRVGSTTKGRVTNFISKPHEIPLVHEIETSVRKQVSMEKVNANIKRILNARYGMYQQILPPDKEEDETDS